MSVLCNSPENRDGDWSAKRQNWDIVNKALTKPFGTPGSGPERDKSGRFQKV